jgi:hypothetical protein
MFSVVWRGCVRFGEPTTILVIFMEMKPHEKLLGRNPLSDAPYLDLDMVLNEQGSGRRILSDALHRRPGVMKNEQGSSHLTRWMRRVRKLSEPSRLRVGTWNVGSLTGKLREIVDTMISRRVNILCVQETKWKGQKAKEVEDTGFKLWYTCTTSNKNGVGIVLDKSLKDGVVDIKRQGDKIILLEIWFLMLLVLTLFK